MKNFYHLYQCTDGEQLFQSVLQAGDSAIFSRLEPDFVSSQFRPRPHLLFQNNALGEWFKVRLAQQQGVSFGLPIGHSKETLEHFLCYFFPDLVQNWVYTDLVSLWLYEFLQKSDRNYLPKALQQTLWQEYDRHDASGIRGSNTAKRGENSQGLATHSQQHLWGFAQGVAELFIRYDSYRRDLQQALEKPQLSDHGKGCENQSGAAPKQLQAEAWQQKLWQQMQESTGFAWHGRLIEQVLEQEIAPSTQLEPLYIIGSGFLNTQQQKFYSYLSRFTQVYHFWLSPARFSPDLCQEVVKMLWPEQTVSLPDMAGTADTHEIAKKLGGLPQSLWLENSLHNAAILSREETVQWRSEAVDSRKIQEPQTLLQGVQQRLRCCAGEQAGKLARDFLSDGSIQYFACSDRQREVEVLKEQILDALEQNPTWLLNDIAVLAPDINQYQALIQNIFQHSKPDYRLHCNFIDLRKGFGKTAGAASEYFSAFAMLLEQNRYSLDECLALLENPCVSVSYLLEAKPDSFWRKVLRHWKVSWGMDGQQKAKILGQEGDTTELLRSGTWQDAAQILVRDYLSSYKAQGGQTTVSVRNLSLHLALNQEEAALLAELLDFLMRLSQRMQRLQQGCYSISEWVLQLENLQEEFLLCREGVQDIDLADRRALNQTLRNFLAMEESLASSLEAAAEMTRENASSDPVGKNSAARLRFPFIVIHSLLQQKLEQNFSCKGRYLTQGITCSSLQPYRSVPFRMICVLGMNEQDFPRSERPLRFDLCAELPQHLSRQAQEQHIFAELLISAKEKLYLFYQDRDHDKNRERYPSSTLYELSYFITQCFSEPSQVKFSLQAERTLQAEQTLQAERTLHEELAKNHSGDVNEGPAQLEEQVWQKLLQVHPLFPFDKRYFCDSADFFSYSSMAYQQYQALEKSEGAEKNSPQGRKDSFPFCDENALKPCYQLQEILAVLQDAPSYFWQRYSGLAHQSYRTAESLPLREQFHQGEEFLLRQLSGENYDRWLRYLWTKPETLRVLWDLPEEGLQQFLRQEALLGLPMLQERQVCDFYQGLQRMRQELQDALPLGDEGMGLAISEFLSGRCQYRLILQAEEAQFQSTYAPKYPAQARYFYAEENVQGIAPKTRHAFIYVPALALPSTEIRRMGGGAAINSIDGGEPQEYTMLEAELLRVYLDGRSAILWNCSPFGSPHEQLALLQGKLFAALAFQLPLFATTEQLLQWEWVYGKGLQQEKLSFRGSQESRGGDTSSVTLKDYLWLLWRAGQEPLPISQNFLDLLGKKTAKVEWEPLLRELLQVRDSAAGVPRQLLVQLQKLLQRYWLRYQAQLGQHRRFGQEQPIPEALWYLPISFASQTLQESRFWLILAELLGIG